MGFSLSLPVAGQPHATEDIKVGNDLSTIQTWANGNIADSDLRSPNNALYRLLASGVGFFRTNNAYTPAGQSFVFGNTLIANGSIWGDDIPTMWFGDANFGAAGKTAKARIRIAVATNAVAPNLQIWGELSKLTATGGNPELSITFAPVVSSQSDGITLNSANMQAVQTGPEFALPQDGLPYLLGVGLLGGGSVPVGCSAMFTVQLYGYNI